jgi:hypothetical protein
MRSWGQQDLYVILSSCQFAGFVELLKGGMPAVTYPEMVKGSG